MEISVGEALAAGLQRHGISLIFSQCFPVRLQHVAPDYGIRQIGFRTENAGGAMADAYARVSGRIAVVAAQGGPGATLLVPPLAEALAASVPILALVEEAPSSDKDRNAFQELDHLKLFDSVAKWVRRIEAPDRVDDYLDMAIVEATTGRPGPVVLIAPMDLTWQPTPAGTNRKSRLGEFPLDRLVPEASRIKSAADLVAAAERPLIVAGGGVHLSGAAPEVARLSQLAAIPVATTNMGKGTMDDADPLSLGVFGNTMGKGSRTRSLKRLALDADLVVFVGTRTNANATDAWKIFPKAAQSIHLDVDGLEVGRNYESLRLVGDAKATLQALISELEGKTVRDAEGRRARVADAKRAAWAESEAALDDIGAGSQGKVRPEYLMRTLDSLLKAEDIVVADASYSTNWVSTFLTSRTAGMRFLTPRGLAGLGWGFPMAIGAKLARPSAKVFAIVGDGGFAHCWAELETARRMGVNVVVIVLNNQILGYQKHGEEFSSGKSSDASTLGPVDHAAIARACGCVGERIDTPADFVAALNRSVGAELPVLLDVMIDDEAHPPLGMFELTRQAAAKVAV